ncbi:hypothetical protein BT96DRAFT_1021227 [Gymnopus androsaceus JB14]|uniref:Peptidase C14 caspase domain-containing protein n=1 Tax=Gymnopus androsaceus JB14 TaxID=1447944 RepID=A0A6A4HG68_9AGAR|nr:hypothetical protein BT96DRAFT_1021227 [Gymnopus androsaceus JB14]
MMWDIGEKDPHGYSNHIAMPSPMIGSQAIHTPAPSNYSAHSHLAAPAFGVPPVYHSVHSYAGSPNEPSFGVPLARAVSAEPPHHHHHHSNPPPDIDRALHFPALITKSSHHKSHHRHSHSADNRHHHHHNTPRIESSGHHHSQSHSAPIATHHHQQIPDPRHRIEHPPFHPKFQYSLCTGRKKALCIGINYIGERHELRGCINDAKAMRKFLIHNHGYKSEDIVLLTDDSPNPRSRPTRSNMINAMHWLVQSAHYSDSLFFHYSGHGGQTKDLDGDEIDGMDEVIFPVDFQQKGHILDDDLFKIMARPLPAGCRLTALFDSCHSGTVLDLPFIYTPSGRLRGPQVRQQALARRNSAADVISFSACKDGRKSTDTFKGGVAVGAMSWSFCEVMSKNPHQSYQQILREVKNLTYRRYHQTPQLGSSHHIDMNLKFII